MDNKKTYIFDFDGTLVDTMDLAVQVLLGFLKKRGIRYPDDIINTIIPLGYRGIAAYYAEHFHLRETSEEVYAEIFEQLEDVYANEVMPKRGAEELIKSLKERGMRLNILTASPHELIEPCIKRFQWENLFDNCWSAEDFGLKKSDPNIYLAAAERLNKNPRECYMIDDNINALYAAKRAGLKVIAVYDVHSAEYEREMRSFVDKYISSFEDCKALF